MKIIFVATLALFAVGVMAASPFQLPGELSQTAKTAVGLALSTDYAGAYREIQKVGAKNPGASCVLRNIVRLTEFDDLGDTAVLASAAAELSKCKAYGAWDVLREFELGYAQTALGHSIKGALETRSAAKKFEDSDDPDAQAIYAIYAYYVEDGFSFLPFVSDDREAYLKLLNAQSEKSELFWALFATPLVWMHYDRGEFEKALNVVERSLAKAPGNPVFLQMKADMLYKLRRFEEAAKIYEKSAEDYLKRSGKSVRYWCAVGNLARIYLDSGDVSAAKRYAEMFSSPDYAKWEKWMPQSLVKDLKKKDLYGK